MSFFVCSYVTSMVGPHMQACECVCESHFYSCCSVFPSFPWNLLVVVIVDKVPSCGSQQSVPSFRRIPTYFHGIFASVLVFAFRVLLSTKGWKITSKETFLTALRRAKDCSAVILYYYILFLSYVLLYVEVQSISSFRDYPFFTTITTTKLFFGSRASVFQLLLRIVVNCFLKEYFHGHLPWIFV